MAQMEAPKPSRGEERRRKSAGRKRKRPLARVVDRLQLETTVCGPECGQLAGEQPELRLDLGRRLGASEEQPQNGHYLEGPTQNPIQNPAHRPSSFSTDQAPPNGPTRSRKLNPSQFRKTNPCLRQSQRRPNHQQAPPNRKRKWPSWLLPVGRRVGGVWGQPLVAVNLVWLLSILQLICDINQEMARPVAALQWESTGPNQAAGK